ncbi:RusA family crossover junction endodeoxyribonuclease [Limosilactobacillus reuteri]|uniref:RusA family crossover junction endodeoxyribonuclease n=1 Tax=Limosilactobacillus reuteri TaxID=1598 RepID=UPI001E3D2791|nr:RusA family crossover junction endodeoxyribonuclease [Limosilactobacillus reuteri]MCC4358536.1 RusA family crossover junction endodeoxyribonuclease [Limosilactobacillus reuteri]MCC4363201.1 RusA family crossover junction endodeoxyribonuclease [Limosilactobacillus reuteri]MCC4365041.1 RusA family crossover junction endodeoxyribonuclease [Limosilactobacillus reuteri]
MIKLVFPFDPVAQVRTRATNRKGKIVVYDPENTAIYKRRINMVAMKHMLGKKPLEGPLSVKIRFYRPIQKNLTKKVRNDRLSGKERPIVKPDLSNYVKAIEDGLNKIVWKDDSLIVHEETGKFYSENPRIEIEVEQWEPEL